MGWKKLTQPFKIVLWGKFYDMGGCVLHSSKTHMLYAPDVCSIKKEFSGIPLILVSINIMEV